MATGTFGSIRPADITPSRDVEIFYYYRPTRSTTDDSFKNFKPLNASECLSRCEWSQNEDGSNPQDLLGAYNLRLPLDYFNAKGFYTVYIRPKALKATIVDVSVLAAYPDTKGIVLSLTGDLKGLSDLTGYRVEYSGGAVRLITSCNRCQPTVVNMGDSYPKTTRYTLTDTSANLVFCTMTPSSTLTFKPDSSPYIGSADEEVTIYNTLFSPKMLEIEMVEHDAETISYMLEGDKVRDRDHQVVTVYNFDKEIYHQSDVWVVKSSLGVPLYDVSAKRENVDSTQEYDNVI